MGRYRHRRLRTRTVSKLRHVHVVDVAVVGSAVIVVGTEGSAVSVDHTAAVAIVVRSGVTVVATAEGVSGEVMASEVVDVDVVAVRGSKTIYCACC